MEHAKLLKYSEMTPVKEDWWFKVYELPNNIYAIFEPYHFQEVASFLVIGQEKALLFDTGMGIGDMKAMVESITDLPLVVVNSHTHFDHTGCDWQFDEVYSWREIDVNGEAGSWQSTPHDDENFSAEAWEAFPGGIDALPFDQFKLETKMPKKTNIIRNDDVFDLGGRSFRVFNTPGHSDDSICLIDDEAKIMLTGDTIYPAGLYAFLGESSLEVYTKVSHDLAEKYSDFTLYCSHNNPVWEGKALIEIAEAFDKLHEILAEEEAKGIQHEITRYNLGHDFDIVY